MSGSGSDGEREDRREAVTRPDKTRPAHYSGAHTPIDVIESWGEGRDAHWGFSVGNALKYMARAGKKEGESELDDLKKAEFYLKRRIAFLSEPR